MTQASDPETNARGILLDYTFDRGLGDVWLARYQLYQNGRLVGQIKAEEYDGTVGTYFVRTSPAATPNTFHAVAWLTDHANREVAGSRVRSESSSWNVAAQPGQVVP